MDVLRPQKVPNTSTFWDKDVSKRSEFPELRPKFELWTKRLATTTY